MVSKIVSIDENVSDLGEEDSVMDPNGAVEKLSVSMQSYEPFCTAEVDSFQSLVVAPDNISIAESSGQKKDEKDTFGNDDVASDSKCSDTICSSLRKMTGINMGSLSKTDIGRASRKCKKISNKKMSPDMKFLDLARRRRRSCLFYKPRVSDWGSLESIGHIVKQIADADLDQNEHKKSRKARGSKGDVKRKNNQRCASSVRSKKEFPASTSHIRLKVTFGGSCPSDITPGVVEDHKSSSGTQIKSPKYNEDVKRKFEEGIPHAPDGHAGIVPQKQVDLLKDAVGSWCLDPGTSPDSEVINLIPESHTDEKFDEDDILNKQICVVPGEILCSSLQTTRSRKGKKKNKPFQDVNCSTNDKPPSPEIIDNTGVANNQHRHLARMTNDAFSSEASISKTIRIVSVKTSSSGVFSMETPLQSSEVPSFGVSSKTFKVENCMGGGFCSPTGFQHERPEKCLPFTKPWDCENAKNSRSPRSRLEFSEAKSPQGNSYFQKVDQFDLKAKEKSDRVQAVQKNENYSEIGSHTFTDHEEPKTGCSITPDVNIKMNGVNDEHVLPRNAWVSCDNCYKWRRIPAVLADSIEDTKSSWICKDNEDKDFADCIIPQEKSNAEINAELDISDASCEEDAGAALHKPSILEKKKSIVSKQSSWKLIRSNHYLHRTRKTQTIDEIMVCHCKAPLGGRMGCGNGCLNRMLNIECVKGTCPCGELCSNNQFQKRKYAKLKCFQSGKKGHGLQLLEDICEGQFLIEYIGEVLDMHAYEARQKEYALKGHKHFYFMTLNGSEVIDACAKGNLGRYINHSCEPNCRTEKWMVNGEVCIGLFALKDIKKGEEVTFDYNYVRVFGAAAKKCVCGSSLCRGYIGGDPSSDEIIVQDDSDEENLESVIVCEDSDDNLDNMVSASSSVDVADMCIAEKDVGKGARAIEHLEVMEEIHAPYSLSKQRKETKVFKTAAECTVMSSSIEESREKTASADPELQSVVEMDGSVRLSTSMQTIDTSMQLDDGKRSKIILVAPPESCLAEETSNKSLSTTQSSEASTTKLSRSSIDKTDIRRKFKYDIREDRNIIPASHPNPKTSHSPSSVKKGKPRKSGVLVKNPAEMGNKLHQLPYKSGKPGDSSSNDPFEAVQVKLNKLLNAEGGISKRKDASMGYLKLLFLTAASGDSGNGETIQSNRDLSMILDAFLKTKSRTVLADIINKNGLQMLHNIMKRCRKEFHKIPILRKLLKVLEYLAVREILTPEHIISGPRCAGVESFRESILSLTEHGDKQVHKIARNFRDKWIPRPIRKNSCMDRDNGRVDFHRGGSHCNRLSALHNQSFDLGVRRPESIECIKQPISANKVNRENLDSCFASCSSDCVASRTTVRKRKSRWDQPVESAPPHKEPRILPGSVQVSHLSPHHGTSGVPSNQTAAIIYEEKHISRFVNHSPHLMNTKDLDDNRQNNDEDVPPGFSSPRKDSLVSYSTALGSLQEKCFCPEYPNEVVVGHPQERFISRLPVSFGIPLHVVEQFGRPLVETAENRVVDAGIPFHPYPPLPTYPRDRRCPTPASSSLIMKSAPVIGEGFQNHAIYQSDQHTISTSAAPTPDLELPAPVNHHNFHRTRSTSNCLERRYFRQQKWSNTKSGPPWIWGRAGRGNLVNNSRHGANCIGIGPGVNELKGPSSSEQKHARV